MERWGKGWKEPTVADDDEQTADDEEGVVEDEEDDEDGRVLSDSHRHSESTGSR